MQSRDICTMCMQSRVVYTANPTWGDIFESSFKAQSSKLERLFSLKCGKRDVRALSFELSKKSSQVGLAVYTTYVQSRDTYTFCMQSQLICRVNLYVESRCIYVQFVCKVALYIESQCVCNLYAESTYIQSRDACTICMQSHVVRRVVTYVRLVCRVALYVLRRVALCIESRYIYNLYAKSTYIQSRLVCTIQSHETAIENNQVIISAITLLCRVSLYDCVQSRETALENQRHALKECAQ